MTTIPTQESLTCEFKSDRKCLPDRELIEAVVCMANGEGGEIYLGVEDDGGGGERGDDEEEDQFAVHTGEPIRTARLHQPITHSVRRTACAKSNAVKSLCRIAKLAFSINAGLA